MLLPFAYLGTQEIIIIAVVVLILFGGSRIPSFAKGFGEAIHEFKKSLEGQPETKTAAPSVKPAEEK